MANNPDLVAARAQHGVAQAEMLQASLPPKPALTGTLLPLAAGTGSTTAYNAGLTYDLKSLITLKPRVAPRRRPAGRSTRRSSGRNGSLPARPACSPWT